ncbi:MAG: GNAT family N-acetyltransferase [Chloroflexota bacterium]
MVTATTIITKRLTLEPLTLDDVQAIYKIAQDKESIEDFQYVAHSLDDVKRWLEPSYHSPEELTWVIHKQTRVMGLFEVGLEAEYSDVKTNVCRIGYFFDYKEHNQGYGTEALRGVVDWLFNHTSIERIEAGVTLHNVSSYRILEKVGFTREKIVEGNWKWYGQVYDSAYYYLLKPPTAEH